MKTQHRKGKLRVKGLPDMVELLKYEMSGCSREELVKICQSLINTGLLPFFDHPIRRTAYDLALDGFVNGVIIPKDYRVLTLDPERLTELNVTIN